ncbi:MAG: hypothetical protein HC913_10355 [Microscillaceae bacterium]|nr:hypothetical protein [Microscillaceae bacterium]
MLHGLATQVFAQIHPNQPVLRLLRPNALPHHQPQVLQTLEPRPVNGFGVGPQLHLVEVFGVLGKARGGCAEH